MDPFLLSKRHESHTFPFTTHCLNVQLRENGRAEVGRVLSVQASGQRVCWRCLPYWGGLLNYRGPAVALQLSFPAMFGADCCDPHHPYSISTSLCHLLEKAEVKLCYVTRFRLFLWAHQTPCSALLCTHSAVLQWCHTKRLWGDVVNFSLFVFSPLQMCTVEEKVARGV